MRARRPSGLATKRKTSANDVDFRCCKQSSCYDIEPGPIEVAGLGLEDRLESRYLDCHLGHHPKSG
jgi:hypothetical protein